MSDRVAGDALEMVVGPYMGPTTGFALTVRTVVDIQPVVNLYVIVVNPADIPVANPVFKIVATDVLLLVYESKVPVASLNAVVIPVHIVTAPIIGLGFGLRVTLCVVKHPVLSE